MINVGHILTRPLFYFTFLIIHLDRKCLAFFIDNLLVYFFFLSYRAVHLYNMF